MVGFREMEETMEVSGNDCIIVCGDGEEQKEKEKEKEKKNEDKRVADTTDSLMNHSKSDANVHNGPERQVLMDGDGRGDSGSVHQKVGLMSGSTSMECCGDVDIEDPASECGKGTDAGSDVTFAVRGVKTKPRQRFVPKIKGNYIKGLLNGLEVTYTVDDAATETMIATWIYEQIPENVRPKLQSGPGDGAKVAQGSRINVKGKAEFKIQLGHVTLVREAYVGDVDDEILLGLDIIRDDPEGPMDVLNSQGVLLFKGEEIPMLMVGCPKRALRVSVLEDQVIPGLEERVIDAFIERPDEEYDTNIEDTMLVESEPEFIAARRCLVAPVIIKASGQCTAQVRVFNPFAEPTFLESGDLLGKLTTVNVVRTIKDAEYQDEKNNEKCCRRVRVEKKSPREIKQHICQVRKELEASAPKSESEGIPEHLKKLVEKSSEGWSPKQKALIEKLLLRYQDVFSKNEFDLGKTHLVEHSIDTGDAKPVAQPPRRVPLAFAEDEKKQIGKMLEQGVVRPSKSPWASPVCLVRKPDGSSRVCIDYRGLNAVSVPIQQPIPRTEDCINALAGGTVFSVGDGTSAYYQVPMREEDIPKTAFTSKYGLLECVMMPMGLKSAGATFQRLMEVALAGLQWVTCLIYLDDVIVFGRDFDEHICRLEEVLQRFSVISSVKRLDSLVILSMQRV